MRSRPARSRFAVTLVLILGLLVGGCADLSSTLWQSPVANGQGQPSVIAASAEPTPTAASTVTIAPSPTATTVAVAPTASMSDAALAIKTLIERANQQQQDAFAKRDPTLMKDTATDAYYQEIAQINDRMARGGVSSIKLLGIEWGAITLKDATSAEATTYETWRTVYADASTEEGRDRNVYTLVLDQGGWKIQADEHPDSAQSASSGSATPTTPGTAPGTSPSASETPVPGHDVSNNWSGYATTGGKYTAVTGTWTIPAIDGTGDPGVGATWVGIGGTSTRDLIQAGTQEMTNGTGSVRYSAWVEILPESSRPVPLVVSPGDSVTVTIGEQSKDQWLIVLKNNTTGQKYETTLEYASSYSSAEWVVEAPSSARQLLPLSNFGTIQFTGGTATRDGKTVTIAEADAQPITMVDFQGNVLASPSDLAADGQGFSVSRSDTPSTPAPTVPAGRGRSRGR